MDSGDTAYRERLGEVLAKLAEPDEQGDRLVAGDFIRLAMMTLVVPVLALLVTWWAW